MEGVVEIKEPGSRLRAVPSSEIHLIYSLGCAGAYIKQPKS